jgi:Tfp pilus assembly protein PilF
LVHQQQGRLDDAAEKFQMAIKLKPDYADAHYYLSLVYQKQGRPDDALKEYQTAIKLKPGYAKTLNK